MQKIAGRIGGYDLTARETEILNLIVEGKANQQIADNLFIAESTVKFHINNIFGKLGVADRTQAVVIALKSGLARL
jgi:DNA-binding NarL/FixJ family response regulator